MRAGSQRNYDKLQGYRCPCWDSKASSSEYKEVLPLEPFSSVCVGSNLLNSRDSSVFIRNKLCVQDEVIVFRFPDEAKNLVRTLGPLRGCGVWVEPFLVSRAAKAWIWPPTFTSAMANSSILTLLLHMTWKLVLIICPP